MADGAAVAPKPGEVQIDVEALGSDDVATAGEALAGLFAGENEIQQPSPAADAEQEEIPAIGDTEDGHSEQDENPAIEPPVSWTAEAKELFAKLPPEMQQAVAKRESDRETFLATQSQKATEAEKRLEAERQLLANDRAQNVANLQSFLYQLQPEFQKFANVDWDKLAAEKPAEWAQMRQSFDGLQMRWNMAQQQVANIQQQQTAEQQKQFQTFLQGEQTKLIAKVPEFADKAKLKAFSEDLAKYAPEFTPNEINSVADHRQLLLARDAMLYRKAVALKASAQTKLVPANTPKPPLKPAARQGSQREEAQAREIGALHDNLRRNGSTQSAADLQAATGMFGKA